MGKTNFLLQTSISLAIGQSAFGGLFANATNVATAPAKVVFVVAEEGIDVMHLRLHAAVGNALGKVGHLVDQEARDQIYSLLDANLHLYPLAGVTRLLIDGFEGSTNGLATLRDMAAGARLLVIDPLRQFHSGDENDSWVMTSVVQSLQSIASEHKCAVLAAHHTNKAATVNGSGDRAGASRGSAAFTDGVRWQLNLSPLDDTLGNAYGIDREGLSAYVRADLAKANYIAPQSAQVLRRQAGGAFEVVERRAVKTRVRK
jgi:RecA-family ATPase